MNHAARRWRTALGAAIIVAISWVGVAPASASAGASGRAEGRVASDSEPTVQLGMHAPSAAERNGLPANIRFDVMALSGPVYIWNQHSAKCMEVYHSGTANGSKVDQYRCNGTATQKWTLIQFDIARFNLYNANSGRCLDTTGNHADGVQMVIWSCNSANSNQIFYILASGSSYQFTMRPNWNNGKCVEVSHSSQLDAAVVDHYTCNGSQTQLWSQSPA